VFTSVMTQYSTYLIYRIPDSGFLMGVTSYLQGEPGKVVQEYDSDTFNGDGTIGSVISRLFNGVNSDVGISVALQTGEI
jgi:hypothetical protein